jgi:hypothetical protein
VSKIPNCALFVSEQLIHTLPPYVYEKIVFSASFARWYICIP